jgi:hypothetical protein
MSGAYKTFCTSCLACGGTTSKAYARQHEGKCKSCVSGVAAAPRGLVCPTCGERTLSPYQKAHGYHCDNCTRESDPVGYARECSTPYEGDY